MCLSINLHTSINIFCSIGLHVLHFHTSSSQHISSIIFGQLQLLKKRKQMSGRDNENDGELEKCCIGRCPISVTSVFFFFFRFGYFLKTREYNDGYMIAAQVISVVAFLVSRVWWISLVIVAFSIISPQVIWCCRRTKAGLLNSVAVSALACVMSTIFGIIILVLWKRFMHGVYLLLFTFFAFNDDDDYNDDAYHTTLAYESLFNSSDDEDCIFERHNASSLLRPCLAIPTTMLRDIYDHPGLYIPSYDYTRHSP